MSVLDRADLVLSMAWFAQALKSTAIHKFSLMIMKVFSHDFGFPGMVIFRYLTYPFKRSLLEEGIAISESPSTSAF